MKKYKLTITLISDTLIGNAEGYGAVIDKDSVFDDLGLPYIPGKRVKGILREQAELFAKYSDSNAIKNEEYINRLFGAKGLTDNNTEYLQVSNFTVADYSLNRNALSKLIKGDLISRSEIQEYFTCLRMMTRIDESGIAADTSLRTFRVLKKGLVFEGEVSFDESYFNDFQKIAALARRIGASRNRGFGHIKCSMKELSNNPN